jgi:hypothetical protein
MNFLKKPAAKTAPKAAVAVPATAVLSAPEVPVKPSPVAGSGIEAKPAASKAAAGAAPLPAFTISHEAIAQAAYFRWQRFGGDEATNWRLAEQELRDEAKKLGLTV